MPAGTRTPEPDVTSKRTQLNVRLDPETEARIARLLPRVAVAIGLQITQSDLVRLAMIELERKYPGDDHKPKGKR